MRRLILSLVVLLIASACSTLPPGAIAANPGKAYFIDILYLKPGKTPADAKAYFDRTGPVVAKHGLKRITPGFIITKKMAGAIDPHLVNVWSVADPQHTFSDIFADPNYLQHKPLRDATFDMKRSHMFMMREATSRNRI